jgi:riboflavin kinase/FMN adenylyltransferase
MEVFDLNGDIPESARGAVAAIGNFDGLHRGHMSLLEVARKRALDAGKKFAVLTFEPHPRRVFRPDDAPFRITPLPVKLRRLAASKADIVFILPFNWETAQLSADDFITKILKEKLGLSDIVIGADFHFGQNRAGNADTLTTSGFHCTTLGLIKDANHAVYSASRVRGLIQAGNMEEATAVLGWPWEIEAIVQKGDQRGRELGFPTANMALGETIHPSYGVYASLVKIEGEETWRMAASNIGIRPMFEAPVALVESYILDFTGDLYGKTLRVRPVHKLRDEAKYDSLEALITAIHKDCDDTRKILMHKSPAV